METSSGNTGIRVLLSRRDLRWNQDELADRSGVSRTYISDIERGKAKNLSVDVVFALADALEVTPAYLLGLTDNPLAGVDDSEPEYHEPPSDPRVEELSGLLSQMTESQKHRFVEIAKLLIDLN